MSEIGINSNSVKIYDKKNVEKNSEDIKIPLKDEKLKNSIKSEIKELNSQDIQEIHVGKESKSTIKSLDLFPGKMELKENLKKDGTYNNKNEIKDKIDDSLQKLSPDDKQKLKDGIKNSKSIK